MTPPFGPWEVRPLSKHFEQRFNPVPLWTHLCNRDFCIDIVWYQIKIYSRLEQSGLLGLKCQSVCECVCLCVQAISPKLLVRFR